MEFSLQRWVGKVAVVTGASAGIGAAIVEKLVDHGIVVAGLARSEDRLQQLAAQLKGRKGKFHPVKTDLTKEEEILNAFKWVKAKLGPVHILINNAGIAKRENLYNGSTKSWEEIFQLNVISLCICTREAISQMMANNIEGQIIHINSGLGHRVPLPSTNFNVYPASKFAVTALAETLKSEMTTHKTKIKVTSLSPGLTETELVTKSMKNTNPYEDSTILKPVDLANGVIYVLSTPPNVLVTELSIRPIFGQ